LNLIRSLTSFFAIIGACVSEWENRCFLCFLVGCFVSFNATVHWDPEKLYFGSFGIVFEDRVLHLSVYVCWFAEVSYIIYGTKWVIKWFYLVYCIAFRTAKDSVKYIKYESGSLYLCTVFFQITAAPTHGGS